MPHPPDPPSPPKFPGDPDPLVPAAKAALRARMNAVLRATTDDQRRTWSAAVVEKIWALPQVQAAGIVMLYWPMAAHGEIDVLPLAERALAAGKLVVFPGVDRAGGRLVLRRVTDLEKDFDLKTPRNPLAGLPEVGVGKIDLIVVPGLAFDRHGNRLGRGKGYYDRVLGDPACRAFKVAGVFGVQVVEEGEIPVEAWDVGVDVVMTESGELGTPRASSTQI